MIFIQEQQSTVIINIIIFCDYHFTITSPTCGSLRVKAARGLLISASPEAEYYVDVVVVEKKHTFYTDHAR